MPPQLGQFQCGEIVYANGKEFSCLVKESKIIEISAETELGKTVFTYMSARRDQAYLEKVVNAGSVFMGLGTQ